MTQIEAVQQADGTFWKGANKKLRTQSERWRRLNLT